MHAFAGVNYLYFDFKLMISISYINTDKIVNHMLPRNKLAFYKWILSTIITNFDMQNTLTKLSFQFENFKIALFNTLKQTYVF